MKLLKIFKCLKSKMFGEKSSGNEVVSCIKQFQFKNDIPGLGQQKKTKNCSHVLLGKVTKTLSCSKAEKQKRIAVLKAKALKYGAVSFACLTILVVLKICGVGSLLQEHLAEIEMFHIQNIKVTGTDVIDKKDIRSIAGIDYGDSVLFLDEEKMAGNIASLPWVRSASVDVSWPDTVVIKIREHTAEAMILLEENGVSRLHYIAKRDLGCIPVRASQDLDFPTITGVSTVEEMKLKKDLISDAFEFIGQANKNDPRLPAQAISELHITGDDKIVLYLVDNPFPIYLGNSDMRQKYNRLLRVLGVLYKKGGKGVKLAEVDQIRMDYFGDKVLVSSK